MNLIKLKRSEELAVLNVECIAKSSSISSSPVATSTEDIFGDPLLSPRLGDDYQVEIPSMLAESEHIFALDLDSKTGSTIPVMWVQTKDKKGDLKDQCKYNVVTECTSDDFVCNHPLTSNSALEDERVGSTFNHSKAYVRPTYQDFVYKGCRPLPDSGVSLWSNDEIQSFVLGLYIFGKNMVQVRKFIECKNTKDVLAFYYGKFYHSDAYNRWANCRKTRSRKCIQGQRMFTGWRQQELLSRMLTNVSKEVQESLQEATKTFNDGRSSLEELVFTLKATIGIDVLIDAVGIGKGKQDLTGFILENGRSNHTIHSRVEIPTGKACSSITSNDIIKFLTGNFRLSKARSNDLFWEAVWPRLLARGWHSERPKNICSKKTLVFLMPGIRKFSRRKLVKGDQYFDSVADVLNKVASDPRLLELQTESAKGDENLCTAVSDPSYLRPQLSNPGAGLIKFTVVDTSLVVGAAGSLKLRKLRSMPFEVIHNDIEAIDRDSSMDPSTDASSNGRGSREEACIQSCTQTNQPENLQSDQRLRQEQSACSAPLAKRQRLSACKQAMRDGSQKLLFVEKTDSDVKPFQPVDKFCNEKPRRVLFDLNQPQVLPDIDEPLYQPTKQQKVDGFQGSGNQSSSADEELCCNGRRHGTRNRPPTAKALEALANGFLNSRRRGKILKNRRLPGTQARPRFPHRTADAPPPETAVFTKAAPTGFIDPDFIIPEITCNASSCTCTEPQIKER